MSIIGRVELAKLLHYIQLDVNDDLFGYIVMGLDHHVTKVLRIRSSIIGFWALLWEPRNRSDNTFDSPPTWALPA